MRKVVSVVETVHSDMGRPVDGLRRKVATAVVLTNPYAGTYVDDLAEMVLAGASLGQRLIDEALAVLGASIDDVTAYGKGAVVGTSGEIEIGRAHV